MPNQIPAVNTDEVAEGQVIGAKYRVEEVLGKGGMGFVVAAHHLHLDERVALKFLLPEALMNAEVVARFEREARAAVRIKSEHVVRVTDVGKLPSGAPYMVMEYLDGEDLASWVRGRGPLPLEQAVDFVLQACVALADAHSVGIVHRDLKPGNLFCVRRSDEQFVVKVLDFGISKVTDRTANAEGYNGSMTQTAAVMGSPLFMSPEQVQSARDVDARSDIWSLGVVLFQLYTGNVPFNGQSLPEVAIKIATQDVPSVLTFRPDAPPALDAVLRRCLEKVRERRYANVAEFAKALLPFASSEARPLVQRISRTIDAAGRSTSVASAPSMPPASAPHTAATLAQSAPPAINGASAAREVEPRSQGTDGTWAATRSGNNRTRTVAGGAALVIALGAIAGGAVLLRARSVSQTVESAKSASIAAPLVPVTAAPAPVTAAAPPAGGAASVSDTGPNVTRVTTPPPPGPANSSDVARPEPTLSPSGASAGRNPSFSERSRSASPSGASQRADPTGAKAGTPTAPAPKRPASAPPARASGFRDNAAGI